MKGGIRQGIVGGGNLARVSISIVLRDAKGF